VGLGSAGGGFLFRGWGGLAAFLVGERAEEGGDVGGFGFGQFFTELDASHGADGVFKGFGTAVVEVWAGDADVAERRDLEEELFGIVFGEGGAAEIGGVGVGLDEAHFLIEIAAHGGAEVAGDAACVEEREEPAAFGFGEGFVVAFEEVVEAVVGFERAFEGGDGFGDVVVGDWVLGVGEGFGEGLGVGFDLLDAGDGGGFVWHGHFAWVEDGAFGLIFESGGAAVPELGDVEACVEGGGGVAAAAFTEGAWAGGFVIDAAAVFVDAVAGVAGLRAVFGETLFEVEVFAEFDHGRGVGVGTGHFVRERLEDGTGAFAEGFWFEGSVFGGDEGRDDEERRKSEEQRFHDRAVNEASVTRGKRLDA